MLLHQAASAKDIMQGTAAGVLLQAVLGAPFLVAAPASYVRKAFELSRVFLHRWTVNLHFLPEVRLDGLGFPQRILGLASSGGVVCSDGVSLPRMKESHGFNLRCLPTQCALWHAL